MNLHLHKSQMLRCCADEHESTSFNFLSLLYTLRWDWNVKTTVHWQWPGIRHHIALYRNLRWTRHSSRWRPRCSVCKTSNVLTSVHVNWIMWLWNRAYVYSSNNHRLICSSKKQRTDFSYACCSLVIITRKLENALTCIRPWWIWEVPSSLTRFALICAHRKTSLTFNVTYFLMKLTSTSEHDLTVCAKAVL